jgi:uncharacterized repeat protein (TIGR01451 family)
MKLKHVGLLAVVTLTALVLLISVSPLYAHAAHHPSEQAFQVVSVLSLDIDVMGELAPGVLGLPGEPVAWVITVQNTGQAAGQDVTITDTVHDAMRIDSTRATHGTASVSDQVVIFSIPVLNPGETAELVVHTTVLNSPVNGILENHVLLTAAGPDATIARRVSAEVFVPTGLPATGYAPPHDNDLPGEGEPSVVVFGLGAFGVVGLVAAFVWYRGRRRW